MGEQVSVIKFTGGVENMRGFKRAYDKKGRTFFSKKGGPDKHIFLTSPNMNFGRKNSNEFQGCVDFAIQMHRTLKPDFHLINFEFKERIFKVLRNNVQQTFGVFGLRPVIGIMPKIIPLPFRIGQYSLEKILTIKYSAAFDSFLHTFTFSFPSGNDISLLRKSNNATHFRFITSLFKITNWQPDSGRNNKYFPGLQDYFMSYMGEINGPYLISDFVNSLSFSIDYLNMNHTSLDNILSAVGIETGTIVNGNFYPDFMYSGSSLVSALIN
jgi:hypothetical protein